MSKMVFSSGAKLKATIQVETEKGLQVVEIGDVLLYRSSFDAPDEVATIELRLWSMPLNGKVTLRLSDDNSIISSGTLQPSD